MAVSRVLSAIEEALMVVVVSGLMMVSSFPFFSFSILH